MDFSQSDQWSQPPMPNFASTGGIPHQVPTHQSVQPHSTVYPPTQQSYAPQQPYPPPGHPQVFTPQVPHQQPQQPQHMMGGAQFADPQMNAALQLGVNMGAGLTSTYLEQGKDAINRYVPVSGMAYYFKVDNSFVVNKLKLLIWPFTQKRWKRLPVDENDPTSIKHKPPREDLFAPDLYIPSMALCTYVLLVCLVLGLGSKFNPEAIGRTFSTALASLVVEVGVVKLACYLLDAQGASLIDVVAYCSYTLVGIDVSIAMGIALGSSAYWIVLLYCACASGYFILRSMRPVLLGRDDTHQYMPTAQENMVKYLLLGFAVLQIPVCLFMGMSPIQSASSLLAPSLAPSPAAMAAMATAGSEALSGVELST